MVCQKRLEKSRSVLRHEQKLYHLNVDSTYNAPGNRWVWRKPADESHISLGGWSSPFNLEPADSFLSSINVKLSSSYIRVI